MHSKYYIFSTEVCDFRSHHLFWFWLLMRQSGKMTAQPAFLTLHVRRVRSLSCMYVTDDWFSAVLSFVVHQIIFFWNCDKTFAHFFCGVGNKLPADCSAILGMFAWFLLRHCSWTHLSNIQARITPRPSARLSLNWLRWLSKELKLGLSNTISGVLLLNSHERHRYRSCVISNLLNPIYGGYFTYCKMFIYSKEGARKREPV